MTDLHREKQSASDAEDFRGHVALKGFFNICREWGCSQEEMMQMLGGISRSTLFKYQKLPYLKLSRDILERISYVLGIYKSLRLMYPTAERANRRIRLVTSELPFAGTSALEYMARGSMKHLMQARRYFDAKRGWT